MNHTSETSTGKDKSYKTRSACSSSVSSGARVLRAAARKAELRARKEALEEKAVLEKRALEVEHDIRRLEIDTEIKVEDAKLATFEKLQDSDLSGQSSSDPRNSQKMVNDWLNDDKNASGFNSTSLLLDDPIPDIGLPQPIHHSKITDQYDSMLPKKPDKHEISSPWQRMRTTENCEVSPPLLHTTENYEISPPLKQTEYYREMSSPWQQTEYREISHPLQHNAENHEMSPPLQRPEYSERSPPLQYTARREISPPFQYYRPMEGFGQHDSPLQWRPSMHETANAPVVPKVYETMKGSNPFASYVPPTQQDANYMQTSFSRSNPFAGHMSPEPNYTTNQSMPYIQHNPGGIQQRPTTRANRTDDMTKILTKLIEHQRESALPPTKVESFDGSPMKYNQFVKNFEHAVEKNTDDFSRRLEMLISHTSGEAYDLIKNCRMLESSEEGYKQAMKLLKRDYGQPTLIAASFKKAAQQWPNITPGDPTSIRKFSIFLINLLNAKQGNPDMTSLDGHEFIRDLAFKLPTAIQQSWKGQVGKIREKDMRSSTLQDFEHFVSKLSRNENDPWVTGLGYQKKYNNTSERNQAPCQKGGNRRSAFATSVQKIETKTPTYSNNSQSDTNKVSSSCAYCGPETRHKLQECRKFRLIKTEDKSKFCREKGLCFSCLRSGHMMRKCKNPEKCETCGKKHHTALHDSSRQQASIGENEFSPTKVTSGCVNGECASTRMTILPVTVTSSGNPCITTYAFMDDGCGGVFMSPELCSKLNLKTKNTKLTLKTLSNETTCDTRVVLDELQVGDLEAQSFVDLPTVYIKDMPVTEKDIPKQTELSKWSHLSDIKFPDLSETTGRHCIPRVSLMIGNNVPAASQPIEIRTGESGEPFAIKSAIGWMIHGLVSKETHEYVAAHFCTAVQTSNQRLEELFLSYIHTDFDEISSRGDETKPSVEDRKFLQIMSDSIHQEPDNHYTTALPFRDAVAVMPDNRSQAEAYASNLKRRLANNTNLHEQYTKFMEDLEAGGYSEKISEDELEREDGRCWYIPHHGVFNVNKPGKIRVVYNCPAKYKGASLNAQLFQGPDLTNGLTGVLMRWRKEPVAVQADIEKMFYQVRVEEGDRDMLRYLWWPGGDLDNKLQPYRMKVHVFGAVSSPSCVNYVLQHIADNCKSTKPSTSNAILNTFYVDDMLASFSTEEEAVDRSKCIQGTLAEGGFRLTKWNSNSRSVIEAFPEEERAKDLKEIDIHVDNLPSDRALGVRWDAETDKLGFFYNKDQKWNVNNRRSMLSIVSSIYDPMGMVAPYVVKAKMILQSLCQQKIGWDEEIPPQQAHGWKQWTKDLPKLQEVKLDRCLKPPRVDEPTNIQFHHFADASEQGYGVISYVRYAYGARVHCAFLSAKARVRPLKKVTIPRLELTAAVTAVRVDCKLRDEWKKGSEEEEIESHFWSDSMTVLRYIENESARFHTFVANRVEEIRDKSDPSQWHYVPSKENPADDCSRGLSIENLLNSDRWFNGPQFLRKPKFEWPKSPEKTEEISSQDPEVRIKVGVGLVKCTDGVEDGDPISMVVNHCSDWMKVKRIVAWLVRLKRMLQQKASKKGETRKESMELSVEELQHAEEIIIKKVQQQAFPAEITALQKRRMLTQRDANDEEDLTNRAEIKSLEIPSKSPILNLDPVLQNQMLKVGGRLSAATIPEHSKHPLILPRNHRVSDLILQHVHIQSNHQGRNHVLAVLREKYWILGAGVTIKQLMKRCVVCRRQRCKLNEQMMADLPSNRVKPDDPPFTHTGMDYFGPFNIKHGRSIRKRYGVLFTCMNSRAVHIEIADSMDTSSCINALRRFLARRGHVKEITSDNGTNLVGASHQLSEAIKGLNETALQKFASSHEIQWKFNTPAASHHGGVWERMIRTVRKILQALLTEQHIKVARSDEELHTLMCEVENTINNRPITRTSEDPTDCCVLTPNHLLQLRNPETLPPGVFTEKDAYSRRRWRQVQFLANLFWKRWVAEYLPMLQTRQKWLQPKRNLQVGDIVLVVDSSAPRNSWPMGKIEKIHVGNKGLVRSVTVKTQSTTLDRPVNKLCLLLEQDY